MKKKVLICLGHLELGGAERQAILLAEYLHKHSQYQVEVIGFRSKGKASEVLSSLHIPWSVISLRLNKERASLFFDCLKLSYRIVKSRACFIIPFTFWPNYYCNLISKFINAKSIWNQRDAGIGIRGGKLETFAINNAYKIVSNGKAGKETLVRQFHINASDIKVIHNGIIIPPPEKSKDEWLTELSLNEEYFIATMIANLHAQKDHITLIKAWKKLVDKTQKKVVLLLAGRLDKKYPEIKELVSNLNINDYVRFLGPVSDIPGLLTITNLCVFSSNKEGLPNGILECMAAGLPVVATNIMGIREAVGEEYDYLVNPHNPEEFADKILVLFEQEDLRKKVGMRNKLFVTQHFSLEGMCQAYYELIKGAVD